MTNDDYRLIVEKYQKLVFTICYQLIKDYQEAENLTQETFISAFKNIDKCEMEGLKPWLAKIATNKAKDYLKSAYIRKVKVSEDYDLDRGYTEMSPDQIYIENEKEQMIKSRIKSLKEPYLKVSIMYFIEQKSVDEISQSLNRPKKTVQTQILRAKTLLKKILKEEYSHERAF